MRNLHPGLATLREERRGGVKLLHHSEGGHHLGVLPLWLAGPGAPAAAEGHDDDAGDEESRGQGSNEDLEVLAG